MTMTQQPNRNFVMGSTYGFVHSRSAVVQLFLM
jgi:hypothetical protein